MHHVQVSLVWIISRLYQDVIDQFATVNYQGGVGIPLFSPAGLLGPQ